MQKQTQEIQTHTFPNGLQVVYQKSIQALPITTVYVFCNTGSAFETDRVRGVSHFVEHMCFKGTDKRQDTRDILKEYDKIGAFFNAYTEKRYTAYMVKCNDKYIRHCSDILGDLLMNSMFPRKEFDKEQKVVVEESIKSMNDDEYMLQNRMDAILYHGSSYEYPIDCLKYHPSPTFLQYSDVVKWYHWFYHPSNMILSVVSNLSFKKILSMMKKTDFVKRDRHSEEKRPCFALKYPILSILSIQPWVNGKSADKIRIEFIQKKGVSADILHIGFRTCGFSNDTHSLKIVKHILNGLSGRLFTALRTKHGLTYRSVCETNYEEHSGYISIHIQTDPSKIIQSQNHHEGVLPIVIDLLSTLKKKGVSKQDVEIAKGNIRGKNLLSMQSIDKLTEYNGIQYLYSIRERRPPNEFTTRCFPNSDSLLNSDSKKEIPKIPFQDIYKKKIESITEKHVNEIIDKYFIRKNMVVGIMYDVEINKNKIEKICNTFS